MLIGQCVGFGPVCWFCSGYITLLCIICKFANIIGKWLNVDYCFVFVIYSMGVTVALCVISTISQQHLSQYHCASHYITICYNSSMAQQHDVTIATHVTALYHNSTVTTALCHNSTVSQQHHGSLYSTTGHYTAPRVTIQQCHYSTICYSNTMTQQHDVTTAQCHNRTMCHNSTNSSCHNRTNSLCHNSTNSSCHIAPTAHVTTTPCHKDPRFTNNRVMCYKTWQDFNHFPWLAGYLLE